MTRAACTWLALSLAGLLAACGAAPQQSLLRWSPGHAANLTSANEKLKPTLFVSSQPVDPAPTFSVRTLPERAAASYIRALAGKTKNIEDLKTSIGKPISAAPADPSSLRRVLVIDVQRQGVRPADRYTRMLVEIKPAGNKFRFTDFQSASTLNTTINVGSVAISRQLNGSLSAAPTFGGAASPLSAAVGFTNSNGSTHNINEVSQLSVNVTPTRVTVLRTGGEGIDLVGNTLVQLSLHADESQLQRQFVAAPDLLDEKTRDFAMPDKASLNATMVSLLPPQQVWVCARASYVDRVVTAGEATRDEGAQEVDFRSDTLPWQPYLLVGPDETSLPLWIVEANGAQVAVETPEGIKGIVFDDYDRAASFRAWVQKRKAVTIGHGRLFRGGPLPLQGNEIFKLRRLPVTVAAQKPTCG